MRSCLFVIAFLLIASFTRGQPKLNIDSLKTLLARATHDSSRTVLLAQVSGELILSQPDSAFLLAEQGLRLAQQNNYTKGELYCKTSLARFWWSVGDFATALKLLLPIKNQPGVIRDPWLRNNIYLYVLAAAYRDQGDFEEALRYSAEATSLEEKLGRCALCRTCHVTMASVYLEMKNPEAARRYLQRAFQFPEVFGDDGWIYLIAGKLEAATKRYDSAFLWYRRSVNTLIQEDNQKDLAGVYNSAANLFRALNQNDSARYYAHQSLNIAQPKQFAREVLEASLLLSHIYEPTQKDSALQYYKMAMTAKDAIYNQEKQRQLLSYKFNEELRQQDEQAARERYSNKVKIYALLAAVAIFLAIGILLWRNNQHRKKAYVLLQQQKAETDYQRTQTQNAYDKLKATQAQLIQSEKMASLGELTAGIAHEIQNPLNFVNNFSDINGELIDELKTELQSNNKEEALQLANEIKANETIIKQHGRRADSIVKGMLQHARSTTGEKEPADLNTLVEQYLQLAYHGYRAKDKGFNANVSTSYDPIIGNVALVPQEIGRVLLNLFNNAFYAVNEKKKRLNSTFKPKVEVRTKKEGGHIVIAVKDNGIGMSPKVAEKVFQPFFTTKPTGEGTGLGLSLSYDVVTKGHGGELKVHSQEGEGAEFVLSLPA